MAILPRLLWREAMSSPQNVIATARRSAGSNWNVTARHLHFLTMTATSKLPPHDDLPLGSIMCVKYSSLFIEVELWMICCNANPPSLNSCCCSRTCSRYWALHSLAALAVKILSA